MTESIDLAFHLNGAELSLTVEPRRILADVLRDRFGLRSIHLGCEQGVCGSCAVLIDGEPALSCLLLAAQVAGRSVTTLEGLAEHGRMQRLQSEFHEHFALQCGFCTPGMLVNLFAYLEDVGDDPPAESEVRDRLRGNLCRCTGYQSIVAAALAAVGEARQRDEASPEGPG
jgi:aerobic-type carbon monoxide dehydrogenase small subunit (CoxS/CutS family)